MPRGVRGSVNYDAQIQKIDEKMERYSRMLTNLKSRRQELLAKKQDADMRDLYAYMQENNLSAAEVMTQLIPTSAASSDDECV